MGQFEVWPRCKSISRSPPTKSQLLGESWRWPARELLRAKKKDSNPVGGIKLLAQLKLELDDLNQRVSQVDATLKQVASESEVCRRLLAIPGVGSITATAVIAAIGNGAAFTKGRQFAAWLGMVPANAPPAANRSSWASANGETATCEGSSCTGRVPCCSRARSSPPLSGHVGATHIPYPSQHCGSGFSQ